MQDDARSHEFKYTKSWLELQRFAGRAYMDCSAITCDLNPIESLWSIMKSDIYIDCRHFKSKQEPWKAVKVNASNVSSSSTANLTSNIDKRLLRVLKKNGLFVQ